MSTIPNSRNVYTAIATPEFEHFPNAHGTNEHVELDGFDTDVPSGSRHSSRSRTHTARWLRRCNHYSDLVVDLFKRNTGLLLVAAAQAFFSLMNAAVKKLNSIDPPVPTLEVVFVRMILTYFCCIAYMLSTGVPDPFLGPKGARILLFVRGCVGFLGLFGDYYSLQYLSLSDATVLTFLIPMCTAIAGALLLGEQFTKRETFAGLVSLVGVVLIARPTALFGHVTQAVPITDAAGTVIALEGVDPVEKGTPRERLIAVGVALIGVLGAAGGFTTIRAIGKRAHPLHSMTFFSMLCVFISTIGLIVNKTPVVVPTRLDWVALLIMIGIFGFVAQTLLAMGLQRETAGRGSMGVYTQIVFATILERIFFHAVPTALSVIGTLLIISSALYVALTKEKEKGKERPSRMSMTMTSDIAMNERVGEDYTKSKLKKTSLKSHKMEVVEEMEEGLLYSHEYQDLDVELEHTDDRVKAEASSSRLERECELEESRLVGDDLD